MTETREPFDPSMFKSLKEMREAFPEEAENFKISFDDKGNEGFVKKSVMPPKAAHEEAEIAVSEDMSMDEYDEWSDRHEDEAKAYRIANRFELSVRPQNDEREERIKLGTSRVEARDIQEMVDHLRLDTIKRGVKNRQRGKDYQENLSRTEYDRGDGICWLAERVLPENISPEVYSLFTRETTMFVSGGAYRRNHQEWSEQNIADPNALKKLRVAEIGGEMTTLLRMWGADVTTSYEIPEEAKSDLTYVNLKNYHEMFEDESYDVSYSCALFDNGSGLEAYTAQINLEPVTVELLKVFSAITRPGGISIHYGGPYKGFDKLRQKYEAEFEAAQPKRDGESEGDRITRMNDYILEKEFSFRLVEVRETNNNILPMVVFEKIGDGDDEEAAEKPDSTDQLGVEQYDMSEEEKAELAEKIKGYESLPMVAFDLKMIKHPEYIRYWIGQACAERADLSTRVAGEPHPIDDETVRFILSLVDLANGKSLFEAMQRDKEAFSNYGHEERRIWIQAESEYNQRRVENGEKPIKFNKDENPDELERAILSVATDEEAGRVLGLKNDKASLLERGPLDEQRSKWLQDGERISRELLDRLKPLLPE